MLDKNALTQLSQLKSSIQAEKDYAEGTVAGTSGRFGFVRLDDGRDAFLAPEKMQRVLPGDRVRVSVVTNAKGKLEAELEKLLSSDLGRFIGTYRTKGPAHFVEPDMPQFNRWLFVPPKGRGKIKNDDLVVAQLAQHPFKDGKAAVKILDTIGKPDQPKIEFKYTAAKFGLNREWSSAVTQQAETLQKLEVAADEHRADLQSVPFVTIDGRATRDMDDALHVEAVDDGWRLQVAIADPASFIAPGSPLAQAAQQNGQTLYMPGGQLSMLPPALATEVFSLVENAPRPALVCTMTISASGAVEEFTFSHAVIRSRAKLAYTDVAALLAGEGSDAVADELAPQLKQLHQLADTRLQYRLENALVNPDQADFDLVLDDQGKIAEIIRREKTPAHRIVEEAMLATNICAGQFLAQHNQGLAVAHLGFREDRIGEVRALLKEELPDLNTAAINELGGHIELLHLLEKSDQHRSLLGPLRRMMRGAELSLESAPHMGLGLEHYATISSPIRRFADLYNHWAIRSALYGDQLPTLATDELLALQENLNLGRQANRQLEQWLVVQYLQQNKEMEGTAQIRIVTPKGFGARFDHNGIDGFVSFDKKTEKTFDAKRMSLQVGDTTYRIGDTVKVKLAGVEADKRRVKFALID